MGWNERGKRGVHHGRTIRYDDGEKYIRQELIVKHFKNAAKLSDREKESHLDVKYGVEDGLATSQYRWHGRNHDLEFSLGKRKRWELPKLVQESLEEEDFEAEDCSEEKFEDDGSDKQMNVCIAKRYIHASFPSSYNTNCVSVFSDKNGGQHLKPKKTFSTKQDIQGGSEGPELCYEVCCAPPVDSWPNNKQEHRRFKSYDHIAYDARGKKALCKNKGRKNKGHRWGWYREHEMGQFTGERGYSSFTRKTRKQKEKTKLLTKRAFKRINNRMDSDQDHGTHFPLGQYVHGLVYQEEEELVAMETEEMEVSSDVPVKSYGKGCAIYIDKPQNEVVVDTHSTLEFYEQEKKVTAEMNIRRQDLEPSSLQKEWKELYAEGGSFPRKFMIDILPLLPKPLQPSNTCKLLFETNGQPLNGHTFVPVSTSLLAGALESRDATTAFVNATSEFMSSLEKCKNSCDFCELKDIVDIAKICVSKYLPSTTSMVADSGMKTEKQSLRSLSLFNSMLGWQSESFNLPDAKREMERELVKIRHARVNAVDDQGWQIVATECGICFCDFEDANLTALTACGHSFCNACWEAYLKTQIHKGRGHIQCPGHKCDGAVDDVTIMSLVPSLYTKFLTKKIDNSLEMSTRWKWCPGKVCKKLVRASAPKDSHATVLCDCGTTAWCFSCREHIHWPASCKEAKKFHDIAGNYEQMLLVSQKELITSVMVKDCPKCAYPIEKFHGCNYMYCILCQTAFCWQCLGFFHEHPHVCNKDALSKEVDLSVNTRNKTNKFERYFNLVEKNIVARHPHRLIVKEKKAKRLALGISSYKKVISSRLHTNAAQVSGLMDKMVEWNISELVHKGLEFDFQARLALEGTAKKAAVAKINHALVYHTMSQLQFIVDRVDELCDRPTDLCRGGGAQDHLARLISIGTGCMVTLAKFARK